MIRGDHDGPEHPAPETDLPPGLLDPRFARPPTGAAVAEDPATLRLRILWALIDAMVQRGYATATVEDAVAGAGVTRADFDACFTSKEEAFMVAYEMAVTSTTPVPPPLEIGPPIERWRISLRRYLGLLASQPTLARLFLVDVYSAGPEALAKREELQNQYVDALQLTLGLEREADRFACKALVAAISSLVTSRLAEYDVDGLRELEEPLLELGERLFGDL